jgi:Fanconi anemia group M protein
MEVQKILKPPEEVVVVADYREKEVIEHLKRLCTVIETNLNVGDFVCSEKRVAIERKTHSDFISSIIDGRIFEQMIALKDCFEKPIIIIEGYSNRPINENAFRAAVASLLVDFNASLLTTKNSFDTAKTIYWIAKKEQEEGKHPVSFKVGKKPKELKRLQEFIIASIPGISTVLAKRLLERFKNIESIFVADEKELQKVDGIGKKLAHKIRKIIITKYE